MLARRQWLAMRFAPGLMVLALTSAGCAAGGSMAALGDPVIVYVQNLTDDAVEFMFLPVGVSPWTTEAWAPKGSLLTMIPATLPRPCGSP